MEFEVFGYKISIEKKALKKKEELPQDLKWALEIIEKHGAKLPPSPKKIESAKKASEIKKLNQEIIQANKSIDIKDIFIYDFPDNRFDSVDLLDIVKVIEKIKNKIKPEIIFTHFENDLNIDHRITYQAVLTATRPMSDCSVKEIYSFEILSSTEWNYPLSFNPDVYFDISDTLKDKIKAMSYYESELKNFPHPRSLKGIELNAKYWGMRVGLDAAEAFKSIRIIK